MRTDNSNEPEMDLYLPAAIRVQTNESRGPSDHINMRIPETFISQIPSFWALQLQPESRILMFMWPLGPQESSRPSIPIVMTIIVVIATIISTCTPKYLKNDPTSRNRPKGHSFTYLWGLGNSNCYHCYNLELSFSESFRDRLLRGCARMCSYSTA